MSNNGTGLVLALADHPRVLLPIIFYNLVQHLVASGVDLLLARANGPRHGGEARLALVMSRNTTSQDRKPWLVV